MNDDGADETRPLPGGGGPAADTLRASPELVDAPERYHVGEEIARGGMGRILAARGERLGRAVAIKEALAEELYARFGQEARVTARLQHPGIVPVYSVGRSREGRPFYAMKLVSGRPLDQVIAHAATLGQRLALLPNVIAVADALAYAHEERVIHRDLKPANVLCGRFGETVVIDWGLAQDLSAGAPTPAGAEGTPAYMPPEQARGFPVDERADVYAIGAILYHALSGAPPYRAPDETSAGWNELRGRVLMGPPPPLDPRLPRDLVAIVDRAMARDPAARYPSAGELAERLREFQTGRLVAGHQYSTWELLRRWLRRHRTAVAVAGAALVVLLLVSLLAVIQIIDERDRAEDQQRIAESGRLVAVAEAEIERDPHLAAGALDRAFALHPSARAELVARRWSERRLRRILPTRLYSMTAAWSLDGAWLATQPIEGKVRLWNAADWSYGAYLEIGFLVNKMRFSRDGRWLAFGGRNGEVALWSNEPDAAKWHEVTSGRVGAGPVETLDWHPLGQELAVALADGQYLRLTRDGAKARAQFRPDKDAPVHLIAYSPDGRRIALLGGSELVIYLTDGKRISTVALPAPAMSVAWVSDGALAGLVDGRVVRWKDGEEDVSPVYANSAPLNKRMVLSMAATGDLVAVGASDGSVAFLNTDLELNVIAPIGKSAPPIDLAWGHGAIASASAGGVRVHDLARGAGLPTSPFALGPGSVMVLEPAPKGGMVALGGADGEVAVAWWDGRAPVVCVEEGEPMPILSLAWSPDGTLLAAPARDGSVELWRPATTGCTRAGATPPSTRPVIDLSWSPDGAEITVARDRQIGGAFTPLARWRVADLSQAIWTGTGDLGAGIDVDWDVGGLAGFVLGDSDDLWLWTPGQEQQAKRVDLPEPLRHHTYAQVAWRPGTREVAVSTRAAALVDAETGAVRWTSAPLDSAMRLAWSPDGRHLAVLEQAGRLIVFAGDTGEVVLDGDSGLAVAAAVTWAPDGKAVVVGGAGLVSINRIPFPTHEELRAELDAYLAWHATAAADLRVEGATAIPAPAIDAAPAPTCGQAVNHAVALMEQAPPGAVDWGKLIGANRAAALQELDSTCKALRLAPDDLRCVAQAKELDELAACRLFTEVAAPPYPRPPPGTATCAGVARRAIHILSESSGAGQPEVARALVRASYHGELESIQHACELQGWSSARRDCMAAAIDEGAMLRCHLEAK